MKRRREEQTREETGRVVKRRVACFNVFDTIPIVESMKFFFEGY